MNIKLVTGQSGSGKTTLLKETNLENVFYADDFVKEVLYKKGHVVYKNIINEFTHLTKGDFLNTKELGKIILSDINKLDKVNKIVMPFVREWIKSLNDGSVVEMAGYINLENEYKDLFSKVILITKENRDISKFEYIGDNIDPINNTSIKYNYLIKNDSSIEVSTKILKEILMK